MEPTTVISTAIIAAISAGVTGGIKAVGKKAILDSYEALKKAIKSKLGKQSSSAKAIEELEGNPNSKGRQLVLAENIEAEKDGVDHEIERIALKLIEELDETQAGRKALAKYQVDAKGSQTVVIGDHAKVDQTHYHEATLPKTDDFIQEDWENFYLKRLIEKCDNLELTTFEDTCSRDIREGSPIRVSDVFTTLYLKGLERLEGQSVAQAILKPLDKKEDFTRGEQEQKRLPIQAIEAAGALKQLVILGRPGGGKSTLVNHLATQTAHIRMGHAIHRDELNGWPQEEKPLPVRIVLRRFAAWIPDDRKAGTEGLVWDYLEHQLNEWGCKKFHPFLQHILDSTGGVIFFDGLDEVSERDEQKKRSQIVEAIQAFTKPLNKCRVIITCREYAYTKDDAWRLPEVEFPVVELDLFRSLQIKQFTQTWYRIVGKWQDWNEQKCLSEADDLFQAIESWPHLKELGQYPLLLTLMAQVHGRDGSLPRDRADLYDRAVKLLLVHWDNRIVRDQNGTCKIAQGMIARLGIRMDNLKAALEQVALAAHEKQEKEQERSECADIAREDLRQELSNSLSIGLDRAEEVINYIQNRAGLLQAEDNRTFRFPHRTFQEYLASTCIMKKGDFEDFLQDRILRDMSWWQEVFLLAAGSSRSTPRNIYQLVDALLPDDPGDIDLTPKTIAYARLSAQAMAETEFVGYVQAEQASHPGRYTKIHKRIQTWLLTAMTAGDSLSPKERIEAGNALNWVGDSRFDSRKWYLPKEADLGFITVPAGKFWMGSDKKKDSEADKDEFPRHCVKLSEYAIAKYPVTVAQYQVFVQETGLSLVENWSRWNRYENHPVVGVSWQDAQNYCQWLTEKLKDRGWMVALPTEAQWERAARIPDDRKYPWGSDKIEPNRANYHDTNVDATSPVGCFPDGANHLGVMDMVGNVWEWCQDWHGEYSKEGVTDPSGPPSGSSRVLRGGSWLFPAGYCRSACRFGGEPGNRDFVLGFRLVLPPDQQG
jgi:formylglycine-generating enzyme required for sulfatase activity/energy-coupling factor transporter ATP-binding protein EcfA2